MAMTLTLELTPELEQCLQAEAEKRGIGAREYAQFLLQNILRMMKLDGGSNLPLYITATPEEWIREFEAFVDSLKDIDAPEIPAEALRRENMYEDRGL